MPAGDPCDGREQRYIILGAGGFAREVLWHLRDVMSGGQRAWPAPDDVIFVDDATQTRSVETRLGSFAVVKNWQFERPYPFIVGVGSPKAKMILVDRALRAGLTPAPTVVHPRALVQDATLGVGGIITPGCVVTTEVRIGDYVILNLNATVGHGSIIEDYCTINPGCSLSGNTTLARGVMLGTGTVTIERSTIAQGVTVGAQAAVVRSLDEPDVVVVGVPARKLVRS